MYASDGSLSPDEAGVLNKLKQQMKTEFQDEDTLSEGTIDENALSEDGLVSGDGLTAGQTKELSEFKDSLLSRETEVLDQFSAEVKQRQASVITEETEIRTQELCERTDLSDDQRSKLQQQHDNDLDNLRQTLRSEFLAQKEMLQEKLQQVRDAKVSQKRRELLSTRSSSMFSPRSPKMSPNGFLLSSPARVSTRAVTGSDVGSVTGSNHSAVSPSRDTPDQAIIQQREEKRANQLLAEFDEQQLREQAHFEEHESDERALVTRAGEQRVITAQQRTIEEQQKNLESQAKMLEKLRKECSSLADRESKLEHQVQKSEAHLSDREAKMEENMKIRCDELQKKFDVYMENTNNSAPTLPTDAAPQSVETAISDLKSMLHARGGGGGGHSQYVPENSTVVSSKNMEDLCLSLADFENLAKKISEKSRRIRSIISGVSVGEPELENARAHEVGSNSVSYIDQFSGAHPHPSVSNAQKRSRPMSARMKIVEGQRVNQTPRTARTRTGKQKGRGWGVSQKTNARSGPQKLRHSMSESMMSDRKLPKAVPRNFSKQQFSRVRELCAVCRLNAHRHKNILISRVLNR
eukprot:127261_1